ncbi:MAG: AAA family ATPase [Spirochaetales bacterium]|nr:AAA family ATPase [Spirochaetales bacterium]
MSPENIIEWIEGRDKWIQAAFKMVIHNQKLTDEQIGRLKELCMLEVVGEFPDLDLSIADYSFVQDTSNHIHLKSISDVTGINKLAPRQPLDFSENKLSVVYGMNGSGKSGYIRLMKHAFQARDRLQEQLLPNVFKSEKENQKAIFKYYKDGQECNFDWENGLYEEDLCGIDIFDSTFGHIFIENEDEVSYEPPLLALFSNIISVCESVSEQLNIDIASHKSTMPRMPEQEMSSKSGDWLQNITYNTSTEDVDSHCCFSKDDEKEFSIIQERLSETKPEEKAAKFRRRKKYIDDLVVEIQTIILSLSIDVYDEIDGLLSDVKKKKDVAEAVSNKAFNESKLEGIGSDIWLELWKSARKYSEESAYVGTPFPVIDESAVCVLCHQVLDDAAQSRFISFEAYVKGEALKNLEMAESNLREKIDSLAAIPDDPQLIANIDAAGLDDVHKEDIITLYTQARNRRDQYIKHVDKKELTTIENQKVLKEKLNQISKTCEDRANEILEDVKGDSRSKLLKQFQDLKGRRWLSENVLSIKEEIERLKTIRKLEIAKSKTNSGPISRKKGDLAQTLVTDAFVERFNDELKNLGANRISVELVKSRVSRGRVLHQLKLKGTTSGSVYEVLSEGEQRIISIAAFLADVTGKNIPTPFVFDDPISSLDQNFEEAVVMRLCQLATERQIITFTHRLSFLSLVTDYAKKQSLIPMINCIREEAWGTGEPGDVPLSAQKPVKALNTLLHDRLPKAKKIREEFGNDAYEPHAKSLCSEFRILIERMIEVELMSDVVQRYRRSVQTMGKIGNLAKISPDDCKLFDDLMTKYSRYEHSQPAESPVPLPDPSELEEDFELLKSWADSFKKR